MWTQNLDFVKFKSPLFVIVVDKDIVLEPLQDFRVVPVGQKILGQIGYSSL